MLILPFQIQQWIVSYENKANSYRLNGDYKKAMDTLDEVVAFDLFYNWSYFHQTLCYAATGKTKDVKESIEKATLYGFYKGVLQKEEVLKPYLGLISSRIDL